LRRVFGILLIMLGSLIAIASFVSLLQMFSKASNLEPNFEHRAFFLIGSLFGFVVAGIITYLIIYAGLKLSRKKKVE